jgi:hypothetical protein
MKGRLLKILIIGGLLASVIACARGDRDKKNYDICRQRIIEYAETIEPGPVLYPEELKQKVLEICRIYGFQGIDEFKAARDRYGKEVETEEEGDKISKILQRIAGDTVKVGDRAAPVDRPAKAESLSWDSGGGGGRAVSLKVLQQKLRECRGRGLPQHLVQFCGMTRILGYVVDKANRDVILVGEADETLPPLYLEDFVIALRNAWLKYAELRGNTYYYSNPGCTIDPAPRVMQKLDEIGSQIMKSSRSGAIEAALKQWEKICGSPQKVGVFGVPFHSRFAWVMVKADYDMKRLVDGSDVPDVPGFVSLSDIELGLARESILGGQPASISLASINRFWFYPGENLYLEDEGVVIIDKCEVKLLTEEEFLTGKGEIAGTGRANPNAGRFAEIFTELYPEMADQRRIYRELENLFRFVALAKILKFKAPHEQIGLDIDYLLEQFPIPTKTVAKYLPGISNVKHFEHTRDVPGGEQIYQLWLPSCGGVSINIEVDQSNFEKSPLNAIRRKVLESKPSDDAPSWDYNLILIGRVTSKDIERLKAINRINAEDCKTFMVVNYLSKDRLFDDRVKPIYEGNDRGKLLEEMLKRSPDEGAIWVVMKGYNEDEVITFSHSLRFHLKGQDNLQIIPVFREDNPDRFPDMVFRPVDEIKPLTPEKPGLEKVGYGEQKGWFKTDIEFSLQVESELAKAELRILSEKSNPLHRFLQLIHNAIFSPDSKRSLVRDVSRAVKRFIKQNMGKVDIKILKQLKMDVRRP